MTTPVMPLLVSSLVPVGALMPAVAVTSLLFLASLGAMAARVGGAPLAPAAIRVVFWGVLAMAVTSAVGGPVQDSRLTRRSAPARSGNR